MLLADVLIAAASAVPPDAGGSSGLPELPAPAQYGILGLLIAALASGRFLVPRYVFDRERERGDRMEDEARRLNTLIQDKAIPAIIEANTAVKDTALLVNDLRRERDHEQAQREARDQLRREGGIA